MSARATTITGTIYRDDGEPYVGFLRFTRWHRTVPDIPGSFAPRTIVTDLAGGFWTELRPGYYRMEVGTDSPVVILVPDDNDVVWDLEMLLTTATTVAGGADFYFGKSVAETVDEAAVVASFAKVRTTSISGARAFEAGGHKYFVWDDAFGAPRADTGFMDPRTRLPVVMAGAAQGYDEEENGWGYKLLSVGGAAFRVYRTKNILGAAMSINVTKL